MSSKEEILARIRSHTQVRYEKPDITHMNRLNFADPEAHFCEMCRTVGGNAVVLADSEKADDVVRRAFPDATRIASTLPQVTCATFNPDETADPAELDGTDVAIVAGAIGVAENGAVWIPQTVKHKALYFIAERLVILLDRTHIVNTMYDAYRQIAQTDYPFGSFISGPSKTADIEQAMVMGAHGAREVLVILT